MSTISSYYQYAKLATAAYVVLDDETSLTGDRIAFQANRQSRIPTALADALFVFEADKNPNPWTINPLNLTLNTLIYRHVYDAA